MRRVAMLGTVLIVAGGTVFLRGLSAPELAGRDMGDGVVSAPGQNPIVPWTAGLSVLAGVVLLATTRTRRADT